MQEMQVWSLGQEYLLEKRMATHSSIFAWRIPWTEEPGRLQSIGSQRIEYDQATRHVWTSVDFFSFKPSLESLYLPFLCSESILLPLPHSVSVMMDHQVIRTVSIWNYVSSLMDQFLCAWPSTERSMRFYPCLSPRNPRSLPVMAGRGEKGMHRVRMLWATPAAFSLSWRLLGGYLAVGVNEKSRSVRIRR